MGARHMERSRCPYQRRPDRVDRIATPRTRRAGPRRQHRATPRCGPRSCWRPPTGSPTRRSPRPAACARTPSASGGAAGAPRPGVASLGDAKRSRSRTGVHARCRSPRSRRWPASRRGAGLPLSRWSCPELARAAVTGGICESISPSTVRRWLAEDAIKPWQYRSWIFITDPDFAAKAQRVLDLYARVWDGKPLGPRRLRDLRR